MAAEERIERVLLVGLRALDGLVGYTRRVGLARSNSIHLQEFTSPTRPPPDQRTQETMAMRYIEPNSSTVQQRD